MGLRQWERFLAFAGLCENSFGALRLAQGERISIRYLLEPHVRGELRRTMNVVFTQSVARNDKQIATCHLEPLDHAQDKLGERSFPN